MKSRKSIMLEAMPILTSFDGTNLPPEKFGTETEADKQIKTHLEKQLNTKISMKDQFSQHRTFTNQSTYTPLTQLIHGECSLENFQTIETAEEKRQELQRSGLSQEEIDFFTKIQSTENITEKGFRTNPEVLNEKMKEINQKLINHEKELQKPETFKNIKVLSRHEMEIEKTLYVGCNSKRHMNTLVMEKSIQPLSPNDPFKKVKELSEKLSFSKHRKRKRHQVHVSKEETSETKLIYDPNIHHVIVPLDDKEVSKKQLQLDDIKSLPRFKNYDSGTPNTILFLKNLHQKASIDDLHTLFARFEFENGRPIIYRLLSGKMKGQAFVEFSSIKIAEKALKFANGYILKEKPLIIQYGHRKSNAIT